MRQCEDGPSLWVSAARNRSHSRSPSETDRELHYLNGLCPWLAAAVGYHGLLILMHTPRIYSAVLFGLALTAATLADAQSETPRATPAPAAKKEKANPAAQFDRPQAPATLPGKGLAQHDFIVMGVRSSSDGKGIRMVKGGQVVWSYFDPETKGSYYDATMLPNGNLLLAHGRAARIITPDRKIVWKYEVPPGEHAINSVQPVGSDRVVFLMNGHPTARILVANIVTAKIEKEVEIPLAATANLKDPRYVHMQARRLRLWPAGTALMVYPHANKMPGFAEIGKAV